MWEGVGTTLLSDVMSVPFTHFSCAGAEFLHPGWTLESWARREVGGKDIWENKTKNENKTFGPCSTLRYSDAIGLAFFPREAVFLKALTDSYVQLRCRTNILGVDWQLTKNILWLYPVQNWTCLVFLRWHRSLWWGLPVLARHYQTLYLLRGCWRDWDRAAPSCIT